jgi:hypothetical protein
VILVEPLQHQKNASLSNSDSSLGEKKKVARSEVRWDATTILFLATRQAFY